ncbi:MAG: GIN domain-containing protein [Barnesiella sp.]
MKKIFLTITALAIGFTFFCFSENRTATEKQYTQKIHVDDFYKIKILNNFNVIHRINPDSAGYVVITGDTGTSEYISVNCKKGELIIKYTDTKKPEGNLADITLYSTALESAEYNGDLRMNLPDKLTGSLLSLKLTGNGSILAPDVNFSIVKASILTGKGYIDISGSCREADLSVTGVGEIRAHKLEARDVRCSIYGNASIGCFAEKTLKAKATGNGTVYYEGNPNIKKIALGNIKVLPLSGKNETQEQNTL